MDFSQRRQILRGLLAGDACVAPASVFDPFSARAAASLGFEMLLLAGSVASATVLGAPDLVLLTLTELAEQTRRITRAAELPLLVDADHGYGNALNVMRCVEELETAGASALTIEDTALPRPFGVAGETLISTEEACGKLRAAVAARSDSSLVVLGRTGAVRAEGLESCLRRVQAYAKTGIDGLFFIGLQSHQDLEVLHDAVSLPIVLGTAPADLQDPAYLATHGVRIRLVGHAPLQAATQAAYDALKAQRPGTEAGIPAKNLMAALSENDRYEHDIERYLAPEQVGDT